MVTYQQHHHEQREDDDLSSYSSSPLPTTPKISFSSSELLDEEDFISINPKKPSTGNNGEFQFSSGKDVGGQTDTMSTADELFCDGKLLPFWQKQPCGITKTNDKFRSNNSISGIKTRDVEEVKAEAVEGEQTVAIIKSEENKRVSGNTSHPSWYLDEDPSPRPPKCTVLWKELLRLKKQRGSSSLSPSSSSSSTTSSSSSMVDVAAAADNGKEMEGSVNAREMYLQKIRRELEKTRTGSIRIRPIATVPVCKHVRTNSNGGGLPPLFPIRKGRSV